MHGGVFREGRWKDPKQLVYWWTKAAEQGDVHAQLWLGAFYEQGQYCIERDYFQAFKWFSMAAKQGQPDAQVALGQVYENGEGVPQDCGMAAYWYRKAADHTLNLGGAGVGLTASSSYIRMDTRPRRTTSLSTCLTPTHKIRTECRKSLTR